MRIGLLGGGTGGHFYPLIAVARALDEIAFDHHMVDLEIILYGPDPGDANLLTDERIRYEYIPAGKVRRYFSLANLTDPFRTLWGIIVSLASFTTRPPDVLFSKGGYGAFPALAAARLLRIPVVIHESDSVPGKVNRYAAKFAKHIAITFPTCAKYFPKDRVALTGEPIRNTLLGGNTAEALDRFKLEEGVPVVFVTGGSQGAQIINDMVLAMLPDLLPNIQIIHQTGKLNFATVEAERRVALETIPKELHARYFIAPFFGETDLRNIGHISSLIVSRAGAGSITMIAAWGKASLLIPITKSAGDHQRENAYAIARMGGAEVIEEANLTPHILGGRILALAMSPEARKSLEEHVQRFAKLDAAKVIATSLLDLGKHETS